uniref:O-methyltransferase domain-containing protein n=1 Tax=Oryza barthii TaxID=65489 RepID=A0A0D3FSL3_9ORYZ
MDPYTSRAPASGGFAAGDDDEEAACLQAFELMCIFTVPMTLKAAIELGLLDALAAAGDGRALTADELAGARLQVVHRRRQQPPWISGPLGLVRRRRGLPVHLLAAAVGGGGPSAFERAHGMRMFEYMGTNRRLNTLFNQAMAQQSMIVIDKLLDRFHGFDGVGVLVDVGGGTGATLEMITSRYKHITGVNFDLPHVISQAPSIPGVKHIAGNMFESISNIGDAIFLKMILHMQNDEDCIKILKNCHQALPDNGKVIAVEIVLPTIPELAQTARYPFQMDMIMLSNSRGGKERTELEFAKLATDSGFSGALRTTYILANYWVLEFSK